MVLVDGRMGLVTVIVDGRLGLVMLFVDEVMVLVISSLAVGDVTMPTSSILLGECRVKLDVDSCIMSFVDGDNVLVVFMVCVAWDVVLNATDVEEPLTLPVPVPRTTPSLSHPITGIGSPVTLQTIDTLLPIATD
jgi:hypothetical protein